MVFRKGAGIMNKLFKCIGVFVLAIVILGIPVLFALSLVFQWIAFVYLLLLTTLDVILLTIGLYLLADYFEDNF